MEKKPIAAEFARYYVCCLKEACDMGVAKNPEVGQPLADMVKLQTQSAFFAGFSAAIRFMSEPEKLLVSMIELLDFVNLKIKENENESNAGRKG